jgi:probable F420-dependent oxidoreductase
MMKFGLIPMNIGIQSMAAMTGLAQLAESVGIESVWTFEHVIVPVNYDSKYPYDKSGKMGVTPETNMVDPLIALTAIAAVTKTLRLGTGVNILSQTNPLYLAKQAASLDMLSNGRLELGLGIGWLQEEFVAMGTPFEKRGARFDDYVAAMRKVWSGEVVEHASEFLNWHGFKSYPVPNQSPLPVIMGGIKGKIHERIARLGDGWFAPTFDTKELTHHLDLVKAQCDVIGRDFTEIEITCMWPGAGGQASIDALAAAGVHRLVVPVMALGGDPAAGIQKLAADYIG